MAAHDDDRGSEFLHASLEKLRASLTSLLDEQQQLITFCNEQKAKVESIQKAALAVVQRDIVTDNSVVSSTQNVVSLAVHRRHANR